MKIAIYETVHLDWILPYCEWFEHRNDDVYFLANISFEKDIQEALGPRFAKFRWQFMDPEIGRDQFVLTLQRFFRSQSFDGIILNSVETRQIFVALALRFITTSIFINVHDLNNFFYASAGFSARSWSRFFGKAYLKKRAKAFIVNAASMKHYIESEKLTTKKVHWLPPVIQKARRLQHQQTDVVTFTIPGSIDEKRRDYQAVLDTFKKIFERYGGRFKLIVAGRPVGSYGINIIEQLKQFQVAGMEVFFSGTEIEEKAFQALIASSSILISPLRSATMIHDNVSEKYGQTKGSGNVFDAIRHGKPMIIPSHLVLPGEIMSSCPTYQTTDELLHLIERCLCDTKWLNQLLDLAYQNSQHFTLEATYARLNQVLEDFSVQKQHVNQPKG
jgi:hypothetical protein